MATYQDGNRRKATPNSVTAARRSAASRACPKCERKSALVTVDGSGKACRWCDYYSPPVGWDDPPASGSPEGGAM